MLYIVNVDVNFQVVKESFFKDEAVCVGAEIYTDPEAIEELFELAASAALDGVSLVAIAVDSGDVAAAIFNSLQVIFVSKYEILHNSIPIPFFP